MKIVHIFLYYLVYDHPGHDLPKSIFLENLEKEGLTADEILDEETLVYSSTISWKSFISPLPDHKGTILTYDNSEAQLTNFFLF